ncbi:cysteine dioxygenase [Dyella acidiphila]|uniref:Cysteine dioxygenase family protein n=1 Tax=Dyella acidiphila TaxID=2775866 RepID=A0ABR9GCF7_9GAMM|nr:cysteine dioxygenase family protein [Dyella acidiphila]MBE1161725.1 cysteine dioxygenase family protein [Dyella acidiphila]
MHDALRPATTDWAQRILDTVDACLPKHAPVDVSALAKALATASTWAGCPQAADLLDATASTPYRRIALADPQAHGYEALLILWPPGHATPIHDHDGLWGMEIMLDGVLEVEAFDLSLQQDPQLVSRGVSVIGIGDHLAFSQADYAHRCRNLSANCAALSLHIYGGALDTYRSYHAQDEGQWASTTHHAVREPALI